MCRPSPLPHRSFPTVILTAAGLIIPLVAAATGPARWTPSVDWGGGDPNRYAVNMILMAGDGAPYHSRILWFRGHGSSMSGLGGGEWGWTPGNEDCASYPAASFTALAPADPLMDVFCSGHAGLADGRILLAGGNDPESEHYGDKQSRLFTPGVGASPGTWSNPPDLARRRWYPTAVTLRDGRVAAFAGSQARQHYVFGGRVAGAPPSSPQGDLVRQHGPYGDEAWDPTVLPAPDPILLTRPDPREAHTGVDMTSVASFGGEVFFGGRRGDGQLLGDTWLLKRTNNVLGADYGYEWKNMQAAVMNPDPFGGRREHTAVLAASYNQMIVFGGRTDNDQPLNDVWRLYWNSSASRWEWAKVQITGGTPPTARYGHTAFFESRILHVAPNQPQTVNRMIVYGGAGNPGEAPADQKVYELRFTSATQAYWAELPETTLVGVTASPAPRKGHASAWGNKVRYRTTTGCSTQPCDVPSYNAYVYGGEIPGEQVPAYSDTLWTLWLFHTGKYAWQPRLTSGPSPGPRARLSMIADDRQGEIHAWRGPRLHLFGGESDAGLADRYHYSIDPYWGDSEPAPWIRGTEADVAVAGHASVLDSREIHARVAEIYDPNVGPTGQWSTIPAATMLQPFYPVVFAVSGGTTNGGRLVTAGSADNQARYLDLPGPGETGGPWQDMPNGAIGFGPQSGVLYGPNRMMVAGGVNSSGIVVGTTKTRDVSSLSGAWVSSATMTPRWNYNLVLLPDGKVFATGGNGIQSTGIEQPVFTPQIWDPAGNGGAGSWTPASGSGALPSNTLVRTYHSTAILLPDGRVLCAGGEHPNDKYKADVFCPSYLFNVDGSPATRPVIQSSPRHVSFGQTFIVGVNTGANVASMCLIRPAATTHGFDENQRFVPLTYAITAPNAPGGTYYQVTVPSDSSVVPPGDYMLFVLNAGGTPSIANWLRIGRTVASSAQPTAVTNLHKQCSDGTSVTLLWTPPGTDSGDPVLAPVQDYDVRYRTTAMNDWSSFQGGMAATGWSGPSDPNASTEDNVTINGLTAGQTYYFRLAAKNYASGNGNWSALSNQISFVVHNEECGGSGGGGGGGGGYEEGVSIRPGAGRFSAGFRPSGSGPADSTYQENTLLPNVPLNQERRDLVRLPFGPRWTEAGASVRLSRAGTRATHFASVRLLSADPASGEGVFVQGGELVAGITHDPLRVTHADGRDLTELFLAGGAFDGTDGDTLFVDFGADGPGSLVLSTSRAQLVRAPDRTGLDLACEGASGWAEIGHHDVRERASDEAFEAPELRRVRLVFRGVHRLEGLARLAPGAPVEVAAYTPAAAEHSRLGTVLDRFAAGDGEALSPGDQLLVDFVVEPPASGDTRAWYLEVTGTHLEAAGGAQGARLQSGSGGAPPGPETPAAFALEGARPNPSVGRTTIGFAVPQRAHVRLEVFDVVGRRVATLADREFDAGRASVEWDGRSAAGVPVRAGVYVCRMSAGNFAARRMIVVRP